MYSDIEILIGKHINSFTKHGEYIIFNTTEGELKYYAEAECCSSSYIEDIDNPEVLDNATIIDVDVVTNKEKTINEFDVHKWTFYKFKTNKGMCTLSFRNESNGYYNGHLCLVVD